MYCVVFWIKVMILKILCFSLKLLKNSVAESSDSQMELKPARYIYELLSLGVNGSIKKEWVIATLGEILTVHMDIPSLTLDVLNILDLETLCSNVTDERNNFCSIVRECEKIIPEKLLKERLEIDTLQDVGTLKNRNFYTKFIRIKTKL